MSLSVCRLGEWIKIYCRKADLHIQLRKKESPLFLWFAKMRPVKVFLVWQKNISVYKQCRLHTTMPWLCQKLQYPLYASPLGMASLNGDMEHPFVTFSMSLNLEYTFCSSKVCHQIGTRCSALLHWEWESEDFWGRFPPPSPHPA